MNVFFLTTILFALGFQAHAQNTDTCDYVDNYNQIGGLDCAMVSFAPFEADSYQWVNCDSLYAPFPNETTGNFTFYSGYNVALIVSYLGCIDTSFCQYVCSWGIEEQNKIPRKLVQITDLLGRTQQEDSDQLLIFRYNDGTIEKRYRLVDE